MKLREEFYQRGNVVKIARELIGKGLFTAIGGVTTGGMIIETEAYSWREKASHAYGAKKTKRNSIMFEDGGYAYVFLCYGMHYLFNIVTNRVDKAEAVLIRGIAPLVGVDEMKLRRGINTKERHLTSGPGKLTKALGIDGTFNGKYLLNHEVWVEDLNIKIDNNQIDITPRIGIDYAGEDAALPWRFVLKENK